MLISLTLISIFSISALVHLVQKKLPFSVCPVCAGVAGTWLWLVALNFFGYIHDLVVPAILMGGSVVGIAYQIEKKIAGENFSLFYKTLFMGGGFLAAWSLLNEQWGIFLIASAVSLQIALVVTRFAPKKNAVQRNGSGEIEKLSHGMSRQELVKKMNDCC